MSKEFVPQNREIVDIFNKGYRFHFATAKKLPRILSEGIFSNTFGHRIKDPRFSVLDENVSVWTTHRIGYVFMSVPEPSEIVGVAVDLPYSERGETKSPHFRIAPREFAGLVIIDTLPIGKEVPGALYRRFGKKLIKGSEMENLLRRVEEYKSMMAGNTKTGQLPIYGTSGNLYFPDRLNYGELESRNSDAILSQATH